MKRVGSFLFWTAVVILAFSILYGMYGKMSGKGNIHLLPGQDTTVEENTGAKDSSDEETEDSNGTAGEKVTVPDFVLEDINGNEVRLSDYRGKKVILNFWAVWCPFCVKEMPDLDEVSKELAKGDDAVLFTINLREDIDTVKKFIESKNLSLNVLMDYDGKVGDLYGVTGIPITFFINRDGTGYGYIPEATDKETVLNTISNMK